MVETLGVVMMSFLICGIAEVPAQDSNLGVCRSGD